MANSSSPKQDPISQMANELIRLLPSMQVNQESSLPVQIYEQQLSNVYLDQTLSYLAKLHSVKCMPLQTHKQDLAQK